MQEARYDEFVVQHQACIGGKDHVGQAFHGIDAFDAGFITDQPGQ